MQHRWIAVGVEGRPRTNIPCEPEYMATASFPLGYVENNSKKLENVIKY
jgi:hypothetical protein